MRGVKLHELWGYQIPAILVHLMPISWHAICRSWNMLANFKLSLGRSWNTKRSPWRFAPLRSLRWHLTGSLDLFELQWWLLSHLPGGFQRLGWSPTPDLPDPIHQKKSPSNGSPKGHPLPPQDGAGAGFCGADSGLWHHTALCGRCPHPAHAHPGVHLREATCRTSWCVWFEMIWNDLNELMHTYKLAMYSWAVASRSLRKLDESLGFHGIHGSGACKPGRLPSSSRRSPLASAFSSSQISVGTEDTEDMVFLDSFLHK